jgi:Peptidase S24-like
MAARVISFGSYAPKQGQYSLLLCELPGRGVHTIGVLLLDPATDALHVRLRRDWEHIATNEDAEVLAEIEDDLLSQSSERGGIAVLEHLETVASQSVRITDREAVTVRNFDRTLNDLYREHVPAQVLRFRTHLPHYSLAVAAGPFLTNSEDIEAEDWIEAPSDLRLDDSLCVFQRNVTGSRNGRLVLVRNSELADDNQYTVKRYKSEKRVTEEGFQQTRIRLESLNPAYPSWDLDEDPEKYQILGEFVRVIE